MIVFEFYSKQSKLSKNTSMSWTCGNATNKANIDQKGYGGSLLAKIWWQI